MVKKVTRVIAVTLIAFLASIGFSSFIYADSPGIAYVIPLTGDIDSALADSMELAFTEAKQLEAQLVILEIDTYGGLVDASDRIKTIIYDSPIPVYAYVKKAISGGTYAALACDRIYMHPGATLGAVEPVSDGEPVTDEKVLSVIEGQLRGMAEKQGRDPSIASAMVRKELDIPGVIEAGKLLTLTAKTALAVGYAEGTATDYREIPVLAGMGQMDFQRYSESWTQRFARFVANPIIAALLLGVGLSAMVIEIFTPGFGVPGAVSIGAFTLYFGGKLLSGFSQTGYIALFILGIIFLGAEIFTAGFGVLGISGLSCVALSIVLSAADITQGLLTLGLAFLISAATIIIAYRVLKMTPLWNKIILQTAETKEEGYVGPLNMRGYLGAEGVSLTPLRPSGSIQLASGEKLDAVTEGVYLAPGTEIVVTGTSTGSVVVAQKKQ